MYVFVFLCLLWLILTVAVQFNASFTAIFTWLDRLGLLPRWTFFAPNPAHTDLRVLVRFGNSSGITSWYELWLSSRIDENGILLRGFFNPYRRIEKLLSDFRNELMEPEITPTQIRMSSEYIALLTMSETIARNQCVETVQFMLAETNYTLPNQFRVVIISDMHRIPATD